MNTIRAFVFIMLVTAASIPALSAAVEKDFALPGGGSIPMCYVEAGPFLMGNTGHEAYCYADETPQHKVQLSGYWIGKYEVTRGQYQGFIDAGAYDNAAYWSKDGLEWKGTRKQPGMWDVKAVWSPPLEFTQTDDYPVAGISYYEAEAFCNWAGLRLPTEAQWEKAARWDGKSARIFPWGDKWDSSKCNNWSDKRFESYQTAPVGSFPTGVSPYGCMDMAGNLWEWCSDWYGAKYYSKPPKGGWTNPQGPATGVCRVMKGGSWYYFDYNTRCAYRGNYFYPGNWYYEYGFRVAYSGTALGVENPANASLHRRKPIAKATVLCKTCPPSTVKGVGNKAALGAAAYKGKDPIGGGRGYSRLVSAASAKFVVSSLDELASAFGSATAGDIVYIADDARIDLTPQREPMIIPAGITIAGNRGRGGSAGPLIYCNDPNRYPMLRTGGAGIRVTGVRIQGPDTEIRGNNDSFLFNAAGIIANHPGFEQDNCEMFGWTASATQLDNAGTDGRVHHCYFHHNRRAGNGYGVYVHLSSVLIDANRFAENRHDIAGSGRPGSSYRACYNISEANEPFTSHAFDMHGNMNSRAPGEIVPNIAGESIVIFNNTFRSCRPRIYIAIRGRPRQDLIIHNNVYENALIGADILNPCDNADIYGDYFAVPAKRAYYALAVAGNLVNGKRMLAGEMRKLK